MSIAKGLARNRDIYRRIFGKEEAPEQLILPSVGDLPLEDDIFSSDTAESAFRLVEFENTAAPGLKHDSSFIPAGGISWESGVSAPAEPEDAVEALFRRLDDGARLGPQDLGEE